MARPLFGHAAAGTEAEADPEDLAVGGASSNIQLLLSKQANWPRRT